MGAGKTNPPIGPSELPASERLESWKEVAAYLKRGVTTVQRWEKQEGLPVYRHPHEKLGTVYAYKAELDAWWANGRARLETQEQVSRASQWKLGWTLAAAAVAMAAVLAAAGYWAWHSFQPPAQARRVMLLVLPFENLSGDPEQEYFSDGLTEEMITQLGRLQPERLGVIARSSAFQYKGKEKSIEEIGRELGVDYILEGSVRREADRVRISAQLVQVNEQSPVWAASYDRELRDILALQNEVARAVAGKIEVAIVHGEGVPLASVHPVIPEGYEAYLKGRYFWNKRTTDGVKQAVEYFKRALEKDPDDAKAYAGLADCYIVHAGAYVGLPPRAALLEGKSAALKALEIDPTLAEAHNSFATATWLLDRDWQGAEAGFKRAISLNPNYPTTYHWYSAYLSALGKHAESIAEAKRALAVDPLELIIITNACARYYWARRYDEAIEHCRNVLELNPEFAPARDFLGMAYEQKRMFEEAITEFERAVEISRSAARYVAARGHAHALVGKKTEALKALKELEKLRRQRYVSPFDTALLYVGLGGKEKALAWLEQANRERVFQIAFLRVDPRLDSLRSTPRFQDLLRRMNFPD